MSRFTGLLFAGLVVISSGTSAADEAWACEATGLREFRYDGSGWADIHLQGYQTGGSYRVKMNDEKTEATGKAKDGTGFACAKAR